MPIRLARREYKIAELRQRREKPRRRRGAAGVRGPLSAAALASWLLFAPGAGLGCSTGDGGPPERPETGSTSSGASTSEQDGETSVEEASEQDGASDTPPEERAQADEAPPVGSGDDALVLVDRDYGLSEEYEPEDLVALTEYGVTTYRSEEMLIRDEAAEALALLAAEARNDGVELVVRSAHRTHGQQLASYGKYSEIHGEGAGGFSARPGHSEHQLGTVVDFTNDEVDYELEQSFGETGSARWLRENAARYGFVMSYPQASGRETGYQWEPWHYRYIGAENAARYREGDYESPRGFLIEEGVRPPRKDEEPGDRELEDREPEDREQRAQEEKDGKDGIQSGG